MRCRTQAPRPRRGDDGVTLIETLVTMFLLGIVSSLVFGAVVQSSRVLTRTDDENRGLQDAKIILDRLGRDVRESRGVVCDGGLADPGDPLSADPACLAHLQLWVDSNSDYLKQPTEVVTWRLQENADGLHFDVYRVVGTGAGGTPVTQQRQASSLRVKIAFGYDAATFDDVSEVRIGMTYDAIVDRGSGVRQVASTVRLRNKE